MKRKFTLLIAALALLTMIVQPGRAWGQSDYSSDYTGNITLSIAGGSNASTCVINISENSYNGIKAGTSSKTGAVKITVPSGTKYLHMHLAGWTGKSVTLAVTPSGYSSNISLTSDSGISGNSPFTFSGDPSSSDFYKVITFDNALSADTDLTFTATSGNRFVVWGVTSEEEGGGGETPSISASNIGITYNATSGEIEYTINNAVQGGSLTADLSQCTWIQNAEVDDEKVTISCDPNQNASARTDVVTLVYTYNNTETVSKNVTVTQAGNPDAYMTISEVRAQGTGSVVTKGIVTSCVGTTGYIQDNQAAICVYGAELTVGNEIRVSGSLTTYNGLLEITSPQVTVLSSGNTVNPETMTVAEAVASTNQGWYIRIENATVTAISGQNTTIAQGESTIVVRGISGVTLAVNDIISLNGNIGCFNANQIANPQDVTVQQPTEPTITLSSYAINAPIGGANGTLTVTYENITDVTADVWFCDAAGENDATYDWVTAEINTDNNVYYLVEENDGAARTAYFKVWAYDDDMNEVYSNLVTISQDEYVAPTYATLPFEFTGGKADIEGTDGLYQEGLGSDYSGNNPKLKFDGTGDWLLLQFNERPGTLTFNIKNNSFSGGTFKLQTSVDGTTFNDLKTYTDEELIGTLNEEFTDLDENVRYIKWIYTEKVNGNVGLGNIALAEYATPMATITLDSYSIDAPAAETEGNLAITLENIVITETGGGEFDMVFCDNQGTPLPDQSAKPEWFGFDFPYENDAWSVYYIIGENQTTEERTAYFKVYGLGDDGNTEAYSELVTVIQAGYVAPVASITLDSYSIDAPAAETEGNLAITLENIVITETGGGEFDMVFCDNQGTPLPDQSAKPEWFGFDFPYENDAWSVYYIIGENQTTEERTVYFKVYGLGDDGTTEAYSDLVTVTQAGFVVDYAILPFEWVGGSSADFAALNGVTLSGNGSDYGSTHAPYLIKLDSDNDYIMVKTNSQPGIVTIGVKMIGGGNTSMITVQGSADGTTFTDVESLTISGAQNDILTLTTTNDFAATDRYVRLYFTKGSNVGVGPITIEQVDLTPSIYINPGPYNLNSEGGDAELEVTYSNMPTAPQAVVIFYESNGETPLTENPTWITATINANGNVDGHIDANTGDARSAYFKVKGIDGDNNPVYSELVTINQAAYTLSIVFETTSLDIEAGGENRTMSFDYEGLGQDPTFSINFYESDGTTTATYDWIEAEITQDDKVDITVSANEGAARSAYFKVQGVNGAVSTESNLVTINQEAYVSATTYTLATTIEPGLHYIIAGNNKGEWFAMGTQNNNNRAAVSITVNDNVASVTSNDVHEFVISGDSNNNYTIYDENDNTTGYLYAASSSSNYLKTRSNNNDGNSQWAISFNEGVASIVAQGNSSRYVMQFNSSSSIFACYGSANQSAVYLYKKDNDSNPVYYSPTEVPVVDPDPTTTTYIVANNEILVLSGDLSNCTNPDNLVIEDGGQLIHTGDVQATLLKDYDAAPWPSSKGVDGWYTIASPVNGANVSVVTTTANYDFYKYDEAEYKWLNQKVAAHGITTFEQGVGYLYATSEDKQGSFAGTMKATNANIEKDLSYACTVASLKGFNLMGNPFTRNLTNGDVKLGDSYLTTYYVVEGGSELVARQIDTYPIKPGQGFMVQATAENQKLVFNPGSAKGHSANNGYISIAVGNESFNDMAYINVANGNTLRKMTLNADGPKVYVMNNNLDYAAARVEGLSGSMPVCFQTKNIGTYTITIQANELDVEYLHLIDNVLHEDIDMLLEPSYSFIASGHDYAARFTLVFKANANIDEIEVNDNFAYQNGSDIIVNGNGELQVFDVTGRMVMNTKINGIQTVNVPATGMYIFRMVGESVQTQKIVVR